MASEIAAPAAQFLASTLWQEVQWVLSYRQNLENVRKGIAELNGTKDQVDVLVKEAERNGEKIYRHIKDWQTTVENLNKSCKEVFDGDVNDSQMACFYCSCPNIKARYTLSHQAKTCSSEVEKNISKGKVYCLQRVGYIEQESPKTHPLTQDLEKFESRSLTLKKVLESLKNSEVGIIGICGMAGVGKTKLVGAVAERVEEEKSFDEVARAEVRQSPDLLGDIQGQLAKWLGLHLEEDSVLEKRARRLSQRLNGKRILVILDGLWDYLDLACLGIPIKDGQKGVKVMFTSRSEDVCKRMAQRTTEVKLLNVAEAWLLFEEVSGISDDDKDVKPIAEEIAKKCGGLPLAIECIGGILVKKKKHTWEDLLRELKNSGVTDAKVLSRITPSYERLEGDYKSLLLLCCLFPEDHEIPIEVLVRYSKGLHMFKGIDRLKETRDRVDRIVDQLKACYLLMSGKSERHVKLHNVVRGFCLSITTEGEHVFMSRHFGLKDWPQLDSFEHFTAISLTFSEMNQLPSNLECPRLRLLRLLCSHKNLPDISEVKMEDLRVLELNAFSFQFGVLLPCLTSLRTLCLEHCIFEIGSDTSIIEGMKELEVLSFYGSTLLGFPTEVAQVTNLKLLDLRFKRGHYHPFPSGVFANLKKLEELYMGRYAPEIKDEEEQEQNWIIEANSLPMITTFQVCAVGIDILQDILKGLDLENVERFSIANVDSEVSYDHEHEFPKCSRLFVTEARTLSETSINMLLKKTESLDLIVLGSRNIIPELDKDGLNNLKELQIQSPDLEYIIDATKVLSKDGLKNLESVLIFSGEKLKGLCYGSIRPPWLHSLKSVKVMNCKAMMSVFSESISKCLMHLQHLQIDNCGMLKEVVSMEQNMVLKAVEFPNLKTLKLFELPKLKQFCSGNTEQALFNDQVSFPALEDLVFRSVHCPQQILGRDVPNVSLRKLGRIEIKGCWGVACIAKYDSVTLLQNLTQSYIFGCQDVRVIFDTEGLKPKEGLVLLPRLDDLWLLALPKLETIWRVTKGVQAFQSLRDLTVQDCNGLKYLLSAPLAKMLVNLGKMDLWNCESVEEIVAGEEEEEAVGDNIVIQELVFPKLRSMNFKGLPKLASIWRMAPKGVQAFQNLRVLTVWKCEGLRYLLSPPALARMLVGLEELEIADCESMEEIMGGEEEEGGGGGVGGGGKMTEFPKLRSIRLSDLKKLRSFIPGANHELSFPSLTALKIWNCPRLKNFSHGKLSAPKLERVGVGVEDVVPNDLKDQVISQVEYHEESM